MVKKSSGKGTGRGGGFRSVPKQTNHFAHGGYTRKIWAERTARGTTSTTTSTTSTTTTSSTTTTTSTTSTSTSTTTTTTTTSSTTSTTTTTTMTTTSTTTAQSLWDNWNESSESGVASDNLFVCMMENTSASGDETGSGGGLSGGDLTVTQHNSIPGATGSPPSRDLTGNTMGFGPSQNARNMLCNSTWTFIAKVDIDELTNGRFLNFQDSAEQWEITIYVKDSTHELRCSIQDNNTTYNANTTNVMNTSGIQYFAVWCDGSTVRFGFTDTKPSALSDFSSGDYNTIPTTDGDFSGQSFTNSSKRYVASYALDAGYTQQGNWYYFILADICLIDNAS